MAGTTIHSLAYIVTANTEQFEKGMIATRQELRASKKLMEESVPAIQKYDMAMANVDSMLAKGLIDKRAHADAVGRLKTEYGQLGRDATLLAAGQERFANSIKRMAAGAAGIFTVGKAVGMVREQFLNIDATVKDADKLGIAIEDLMRLRGVADMAGDASAESVDAAIAKLNRNLKDLREGGDAAIAMFEQIGITAEQMQGLDLGEAFLKVSDGIAMIQGADKQLAVTQEILGKGAGDLANMLKMGSTEIERMGAAIPAVNALDAEKIAKAKDAMESVDRSMTSIAQTLTVAMAPAIENLATAVRYLFEGEKAFNLPDNVGIARRATEANMAGSEKIQQNIRRATGNQTFPRQFDEFMNAAAGINPDFNIDRLRASSEEAARLINRLETGKFFAINNMTAQQTASQQAIFDSLLNEVAAMRQSQNLNQSITEQSQRADQAKAATQADNQAKAAPSPAAAMPSQQELRTVFAVFDSMHAELSRIRAAQEQANDNKQSEGAKIE